MSTTLRASLIFSCKWQKIHTRRFISYSGRMLEAKSLLLSDAFKVDALYNQITNLRKNIEIAKRARQEYSKMECEIKDNLKRVSIMEEEISQTRYNIQQLECSETEREQLVAEYNKLGDIIDKIILSEEWYFDTHHGGGAW